VKLLDPEYVHEDNRRTLTQLFTDNIKQVNHYHADGGSVLGNHYHKETTEYFYVVKGNILYNEKAVLTKGDCFVVYPQENHKLECIGEVELISFLTKPYTEEDPDIWQKSL